MSHSDPPSRWGKGKHPASIFQAGRLTSLNPVSGTQLRNELSMKRKVILG